MGIAVCFLLHTLWGLHKKRASTLPYIFHSNLTVSSSTVFPQTKDTGDNVLMLLMYFNCKSENLPVQGLSVVERKRWDFIRKLIFSPNYFPSSERIRTRESAPGTLTFQRWGCLSFQKLGLLLNNRQLTTNTELVWKTQNLTHSYKHQHL